MWCDGLGLRDLRRQTSRAAHRGSSPSHPSIARHSTAEAKLFISFRDKSWYRNMMRMTKRTGYIALYLWLAGAASGAGGALAQQQSFACTKLCWAPAKASVTCSKKLNAQIELTSYIYAVEHKAIAKGKAMTFFVDMRGSGQSCGSAAPPEGSLSVVGYLNAQHVTSFTIGGLKVGDTIEIGATGVAEGEKNILFFPDPTQK
jgi:hypothetical protein